jgi:excisionase family DNA binding protein
MKTLLTTAQAAERLGVHGSRVRALIAAGRLKATLIGTQWVITEAALAAVATRVNGRPRKKAVTK